MSKVVILTDSASDIDESLKSSLGIEMVPLKVSFGTETFVDGELSASAFYEKLKQSAALPTTSQPSPLDFVEKYNEIIEKHGKDVQIIAILLSSALSGTYQSAVIAKNMLDQAADITLIDSKKASFIHGLCVVEAARAAQAGQSKQQILDAIDRYLQDVQVYFVVDTLTYLQKGGRIGAASALIGSLLNIKPILTLTPAGTVAPFDKVRGSKKAQARMMEALKTYAGDSPVKTAVIHADAKAEAEAILLKVKEEFNVTEAYISEIGAIVGTHTGPGTLGCMIVKA